jgi:hypothetical protein
LLTIKLTMSAFPFLLMLAVADMLTRLSAAQCARLLAAGTRARTARALPLAAQSPGPPRVERALAMPDLSTRVTHVVA